MKKSLFTYFAVCCFPAIGLAADPVNNISAAPPSVYDEPQQAAPLNAQSANPINFMYQCAGDTDETPQSGFQYVIDNKTTYSVLYAEDCDKSPADKTFYTCETAIFANETLPDGREEDDYYNCTSPYPTAKLIDHLSFVRPPFQLPTEFNPNNLGPGGDALENITPEDE